MCAVYLVLRQREHPDMGAVIYMTVEHSGYSLTSCTTPVPDLSDVTDLALLSPPGASFLLR